VDVLFDEDAVLDLSVAGGDNVLLVEVVSVDDFPAGVVTLCLFELVIVIVLFFHVGM
jgi:hypothetical protein